MSNPSSSSGLPEDRSPNQTFTVKDSKISDSQVGGQSQRDLLQAGGDISYSLTINNSQPPSGEETQNTENLEKELRAEFQETLDSIKRSILHLKTQLEEKLAGISLDDRDEIIRLIDALLEFVGYQSESEIIEKERQLCYSAADWLVRHRNILIAHLTEYAFNHEQLVISSISRLSSKEVEALKSRFRHDIRIYLDWIKPYLATGRNPMGFDPNWLNQDFDNQVYARAFTNLLSYYIHPDNGHLDWDMAEMVGTYINVYIVEPLES